MNKPISYFLLFLLLCLGWAGCSPTSKGPIAKAYQNTTARYNAYFLGNERLKVIQSDIYTKSLPDYNRLLPVFPVVDTTMASGFKKDLEEVIKKASYPIQKHPTSDWTDDSYLLIGKARFIGLEYDDAIKTFKYVNSTSKTEETKHEALLWLMRSFIYNNELESAKAVSDIMKKQFLNKENATLLFLTRAQYYLLLNDTKLAIENLKLAVPLIEKKDEEARIRFILGQLYQETNQDKLAYQQFTKILRKTPPYELGFQSKLRLGQVTEIANAGDKERIDKYFRKLRKDTKNKEYLDKVYYEMARFELKQNKPVEALALLNQSVKASSANVSQKGYSYLLAGQIYYDKLLKYPLAQAYYDSAVQVLPKNASEYIAAAERRDVLNEFITQLNIIQRQDSLLALSNLDKTALDARITQIIVQTQEKKALEERKLAAAASQPAATNNNALSSIFRNPAAGTNNPGNPTANAGGLWYFDNPATISTARSEFIRNWGNRKLQDNWRISSQAGTQTITADPATVATNTGPTESDVAAQTEAMRMNLVRDIPVTAEQKMAASKQIEDGLFALGAIYRLRLKEPTRAVETYEKLISRFPKSKYLPEVYYTLFLMYKETNDPKQSTYAGLLKQQFPNTRYAKLIDEPDYLVRISERDKLVRALYDSAFTLYEDQKYPLATNVLNNIRKDYPDTEIMDKIAFLNVMIIGQTEQPTIFKLGLQQFITLYPASPLADKARTFLASITLYESGKLSEAEFDKTHPVQAAFKSEENIPEPTPASTQINNSVPAKQPTTLRPKANALKSSPAQNIPTVPNTTPAPDNTVIPPPSFPTVEAGGPKYVSNLAVPHMVLVAYPKGNAAFTDVVTKIQGYNEKYNAADKLTVEIMPLGPELEVALVRGFIDGNKAKAYAIKQKSPQSPLSKIRGIKFDTFVISSENLPILLKGGDVAEYLTFYKNNY